LLRLLQARLDDRPGVQNLSKGGNDMRAIFAALWLLVSICVVPAAAQQGIVKVPTVDPVMDAAIDKAKASLPTFWSLLASPKNGDKGFAVKIRYDLGGNNSEHIWAGNVVLEGKSVSATINNQPRDIPNLKMGQRVTVPIDRISDWMFIRDDKIHGGQTIRAVLQRLPAEQAAQLKARLAPE
jgi:uncharacterized protein YegJ (DUF2314 family)